MSGFRFDSTFKEITTMRRPTLWLLLLLMVMLRALLVERADARIVVGVSTVKTWHFYPFM